MERFSDCSLYAQDFKCFGGEAQGFSQIRRLNLIIGRNNTGKSALLDLVRFAVEPYDLTPYAYLHKVHPSVYLHRNLDEALIRRVFPGSTSGGGFPGNHFEYGVTLIGARMQVELPSSGTRNGQFVLEREYIAPAKKYLERGSKELVNPFAGLRFARIAAERDIVAEAELPELGIGPDGRGATNIIQRVINDEGLPSELVEEVLRADLNNIMGPDANFSRITIQRTAGQKWMIFLDERGKGRISMADSGSGLKTILLVLINMLILPRLEGKETSWYVFAFEELENNLHPGLQRRLLRYVQDKLAEVGAIAFVTTHSAAVIDMFGRAEDAQLLHVIHDGRTAKVLEVIGSSDGHGVLNDLDVKASDLLQANGVVWVEGISDVIYLRRWIELYCQQTGKPVPAEGSEFAFMTYGGRCLSHLDFTTACAEDVSEEDARWLLPALALSRNTYVVMDSDKSNGNAHVNATKTQAAQTATGSWITEGREIENYLPVEVAGVVFGKELNKYEAAPTVHQDRKGTRLDKKKAAMEAVRLLSTSNWRKLDLEGQVGKLVEAINSWNPIYVENEAND